MLGDYFYGNSFFVISLLVFVSVMLLLEGLYLLWKTHKGPEARRIDKRLRALSASADADSRAQLLKERTLSEIPALQQVLIKLPRAHHLDRFILQAGLDWTVANLLLCCAAFGAIALLTMAGVMRQPMWLSLGSAAFLAALPLLYVQHIRSRRLNRLQRQLPEALDLVTRALRAGHSFSSGLQMIAEEMAEPIAGEFRIVADEVNFGVSLQQALTNLSERIPLTDLRYFVVSVLIQRDSGGNLTEVLGNLSRLIRERLKLLARVRVLSSEGRMSAWVLGLTPFGLGALMNTFNPEFMAPLWTDPIGIAILQYLLSLMAFGALILRKIVRIHV